MPERRLAVGLHVNRRHVRKRKGLHVLRGQIGTDKFWAGIRDYYRRYRDSNASTSDFRKVMEQASASDLGWVGGLSVGSALAVLMLSSRRARLKPA